MRDDISSPLSFSEATPSSVFVNFSFFKTKLWNSCCVAEQKRIRLVTVRLRVWSLASLSGLRIQCCSELWFRLQKWLGSDTAVAWASSFSSNLTPSLGTSMCHGCGPKKKKEKALWKDEALWFSACEVKWYHSEDVPVPPLASFSSSGEADIWVSYLHRTCKFGWKLYSGCSPQV